MPRRVAVIGPIVEPHGIALFDTNSWYATPAWAHARAQNAAPRASVAVSYTHLTLPTKA